MPPATQAKTERRAIAAHFVLFALMVQAIIPTHVMAADKAGDITICTADGAHSLDARGHADSPASRHGPPCQDCLAAALVAAAPPPVLAIQPVAYAVARVEHLAASISIPPRARAPPRPPGQGPPASLQTA